MQSKFVGNLKKIMKTFIPMSPPGPDLAAIENALGPQFAKLIDRVAVCGGPTCNSIDTEYCALPSLRIQAHGQIRMMLIDFREVLEHVQRTISPDSDFKTVHVFLENFGEVDLQVFATRGKIKVWKVDLEEKSALWIPGGFLVVTAAAHQEKVKPKEEKPCVHVRASFLRVGRADVERMTMVAAATRNEPGKKDDNEHLQKAIEGFGVVAPAHEAR